MLKYRLFICLIVSSIVFTQCSRKSAARMELVNGGIKDVMIHSGQGVGPCEPTICISPVDPNIVIAGSVLDNVYVSKNGGKSWEKNKLKSTYGVYGDPVIRFDNKGKAYYAHLSNPDGKAYSSQSFLDRIVVQSSEDNGQSWTNGSFPPGDTLTDHDKHWLAVDPLTNAMLMSWTEFDKYGSKDPNDKSRILFSKSSDGGDTWTSPLAISQFEGDCIDDDKTTEGCTPAVGVNGDYYLTWSYDDKIYFDKSTDGGKTWLSTDIVVADQPGGWTYNIEGLGRCNGMPIIEVDHSNSKNRGTLYINWSDQRNGEENTDVWLSKSNDGGMTWSNPIRVNDDKGSAQQFLTWMDVDPITGNIFIVFYDRRGASGTNTNVYLAYSTDGGNSFVNMQINKKTFEAKEFVFFGDYNDISAYNGRVRPIWTQQDNYKLSVHTALIDFKQ